MNISERRAAVFNAYRDTEGTSQAVVAYANELKRKIDDLRDEYFFVVDKPEFDTVEKIERVTHHYRRLIAGYHQFVELLDQGPRSIEAAIDDEMIVLEGQR